MELDFSHKTEQIIKDSLVQKVKNFDTALIFGGGESGDWVRSFIESLGIVPKCYIDNYKPKQGTEKNGLMILSFEDAVSKYKDACICIGSLWADQMLSQIKQYDSSLLNKTIDFRGPMVWEIKEKIFKSNEFSHINSKIEQYKSLENNLSDEESKQVLKGILNYRITRDEAYLRDIVSNEDEYIDKTVVPQCIISSEVSEIVDGGAFDGDTIELLLSRFNSDKLVIHCFEPSKANADRIREKEKLLNNVKIHVHESGLQECSGKGYMAGGGLGGTIQANHSNDGNGGILLECLDDIKWTNLKMIKLDIEGAERDALRGGIKSIKEYRPVLAICAYHKQDDLLALSDFIAKLDNYKIYLRHYMNATSETIMYGIPAEMN